MNNDAVDQISVFDLHYCKTAVSEKEMYINEPCLDS